MKKLSFGCVIHLGGLRNNAARGVTLLPVVAFGSNRAGHIARSQRECSGSDCKANCSKDGRCFDSAFCFVIHILKFWVFSPQNYYFFLT